MDVCAVLDVRCALSHVVRDAKARAGRLTSVPPGVSLRKAGGQSRDGEGGEMVLGLVPEELQPHQVKVTGAKPSLAASQDPTGLQCCRAAQQPWGIRGESARIREQAAPQRGSQAGKGAPAKGPRTQRKAIWRNWLTTPSNICVTQHEVLALWRELAALLWGWLTHGRVIFILSGAKLPRASCWAPARRALPWQGAFRRGSLSQRQENPHSGRDSLRLFPRGRVFMKSVWLKRPEH